MDTDQWRGRSLAPLERARGFGMTPAVIRLDINSLLAEEDDQAAWGQGGSQVVTSGDTVGEEQDGVVFEGTGIIQDVVFANVFLDFPVEQRTKVYVQGFHRR